MCVKQSNIPMIIVSVIAFAVLLAVIGGSVFLIAYHIKYKDAPLSPGMPAQTQQKSETPAAGEETANASSTAPQETAAEEPSNTEGAKTEEELPTENARFEGDYVLKITRDAGQTYFDSITFCGDTVVYSLPSVKPETSGRVWFGKDGEFLLTAVADGTAKICTSAEDEGASLSAALEKNKPKILALVLSAEQAALSKEAFRQAYDQLIEGAVKASYDTTVICFTVFPARRKSESTTALTDGVGPENIAAANDCIVECVKKHNIAGENVYLLDAWSSLADSEGYLPDALSTGDGLHLTAAAYDAVFAYLRTHRVPEV